MASVNNLDRDSNGQPLPDVDSDVFGGAFTSPTIVVNPTRGLRVNMTLVGGATVNAGGVQAKISFSATDTFSLALSGGVLNLPAGFSAFSNVIPLVDNRYTSPLAPVGPVSASAPGSLTLLGFALLAVIWHRRFRQRKALQPIITARHRRWVD